MSGLMLQHIAVWVVVAGCVGLVGYRGIASLLGTLKRGTCACPSCPNSGAGKQGASDPAKAANKHNPHTTTPDPTGLPQQPNRPREFFIPSSNLTLRSTRVKENAAS